MQGDKCIPQHEAEVHSPTKGLYTHGQNFYLDGREFRILSGSFHYFRTQPAQWGDRLLKIKAAGLNTVTTYIPWNLHEKMRGQYEFTGLWDVASFIRQVHKVGLKMIVRPGPYICAEWEWGGLPHWLLNDTTIKVRSSSSRNYMAAVEKYFSRLLPILAAYQYKKGNGPIIAFQVENEFGSYGQDPAYLQALKSMFDKYGIDELLFTSDGKNGLRKGSVPGVLMTVNFQRDANRNLKALLKTQPDKPLMVGEYWSGWFDHWGESHHTQNITDLRHRLTSILKDYNASINFYMFVGGTNFGFWNGANFFRVHHPTITSYDYDAPISECGDITPKYLMIKELIASLGLAPMSVPEVPGNTPKRKYLAVIPRHHIPYMDLIQYISPAKITTHASPLPMEKLDINDGSGQGYGYILYRKKIKDITYIQLNGQVNDRVIVMNNNQKIVTLEPNKAIGRLPVRSRQSESTVDILVENTGRVNFKNLNNQSKGIVGTMRGDGLPLTGDWIHVPFEFDEAFVKELSKTNAWKEFNGVPVPAVFRVYLEISAEPQDTFIDMKAWGKGIVIVNGFNIGRYFEIGPQQTLYLPAPLLNRGTNEIFIFETEGVEANETPPMVFLDEPILQCKRCKRSKSRH